MDNSCVIHGNSCSNPPLFNANYRKWNVNARQWNVNNGVLNSPSKIEGVPEGRGRMIKDTRPQCLYQSMNPALIAN